MSSKPDREENITLFGTFTYFVNLTSLCGRLEFKNKFFSVGPVCVKHHYRVLQFCKPKKLLLRFKQKLSASSEPARLQINLAEKRNLLTALFFQM